jgi:hypothetical protein
MSDSIEVKNIFVSSGNRDITLYPTGSSYTLHFVNPVKNIQSVELLHASVPNTLYNLTNGLNIISVSSTSGSVFTFSLPAGFYSATGIASELQNAIFNKTGVAVEFLPNENKYLFSTASTNPPFTANVQSAELAKILGFSPGVLVTSATVAVTPAATVPLYSDNLTYKDKNFIVSPFMGNINTDDMIFLDIEELRTPVNQEAVILSGNTVTGRSMTRTFGIIPLDGPNGTVKKFSSASDYSLDIQYPYPIQQLDRLTVSWVDKNGAKVNFNGNNDNSFLLRLHCGGGRRNMC